MHRHPVVTVVVAIFLLVAVAACGGAAASPSSLASSTEAPTEAPVTEPPPATEAPSDGASPTVGSRTTAAAKCGGVALRKEPSIDGEVIVRAKAGTKVRVIETVGGDAYEAGGCGTAGDTWLKVDRIAGKSIQAQYGVPFGYVAAGFFE